MTIALRAFCVLAAVVGACPAFAGDAPRRQLNLLCTVTLPWCEALATAFEKKNGIKVAVTQKERAEVLPLLSSQRASPRFDVWYAGTADLHLQAAELGLVGEYRSPQLDELRDWAVRQAQQTRYRSVGLYLRAVGVVVNERRLAAKQLPEPKCWTDLARPEYDDQLDMGHPTQSSAARATLLALVQALGEEKAFDLIRRIHVNVNKYMRRAGNAARAVARGEATVAAAFVFTVTQEIVDGFPVKLIVPCEGLPYDVLAMSIVSNARNAEDARAFYEWALTPESLQIAYKFSYWQMPAHRNAELPVRVLNTDQAKLIDVDVARFGTAERRRLFDRWNREVSIVPRK